jgi:7-cyano-7-deazaguanosine (preQ0) biosynthesis protein QueE
VAPLTLVVSEVFGPTIQGEGPSAGRCAGFIRLGGCNLRCRWCDAAYTWDAARYDLREETRRLAVEEIAARALQGGPPLVVITGGEPLLHQAQPGWDLLLDRLAARAEIEIETNGTVMAAPATLSVARLNVSPKLAHSGDPRAARIRPAVLAGLADTRRAVFKFVCRDIADLDEAEEIAVRAAIPAHRIWIMPEGTTREEITARLALLAQPAADRGWNITTRLHIHAWGNERGR